MAIGDHVKKYQAEKAAKAAAAAVEPDTPEAEQPDAGRVPNTVAPSNAIDMTTPAVSQSDFLAAMKLLIQEIRSSDVSSDAKERLAMEAERLALEQERVKREMPENKQSPGISVYSHPEGELAHPKEPLKCKMFWVGYELNTDTITPAEVALLNKLEPGTFKVTKSDGTVIPFTVSAKHNDRFQLEELSAWFPCKGDHRHNHGSMTSYIQQAIGEHIPTADELLVELARLKAELAREKAGVLSAV